MFCILRALATVAVSDLRNFNLHDDQAEVAAGSLLMIAYTRNAAFNTRKKNSVR